MKELTLLFLRQGDEVLLAMKKRGFGEGRWNGVGGKVEKGESIEQALVREAQEEISITPTGFEKVADLSFDEFFNGQPAQMHVHVFTADEWSGTPTESDEMKPEWFNVAELPYDAMWSDDPYWLPLVLEGRKITASFVLDSKDIITNHKIKEVKSFS